MGLSQRFDSDLKQAMMAKDETKVSTLRMLKAALSNQAIAKNKSTLEDPEVMDIIAKQIKQHEESVAAFKKGNRPELVQKEEKELAILKSYLPAPLSDEALEAVVQETVRQLGVSGAGAMGQVMKAVMSKVGLQADGKKVNERVRAALGV